MIRITPEHITKLQPNEIFVFGSNYAGRHGRGAAVMAVKFGARYGLGEGLSGQSYGIPTKNERIQTLSLPRIHGHVQNFLQFAKSHPELVFLVTPIGCGLAGYHPRDIAPMFYPALEMENVFLPKVFHEVFL